MAMCKLSKQEKAQLQGLLDTYDGARSALVDALSDIQGEWESAMDDKSEKWKEGEAGTEAQERLDTLKAWLDELPDDIPIDLDQIS